MSFRLYTHRQLLRTSRVQTRQFGVPLGKTSYDTDESRKFPIQDTRKRSRRVFSGLSSTDLRPLQPAQYSPSSRFKLFRFKRFQSVLSFNFMARTCVYPCLIFFNSSSNSFPPNYSTQVVLIFNQLSCFQT